MTTAALPAPPDIITHLTNLRRLPSPERRRSIRKAAGASQAYVGASLGVSASAVAHWEAGDRQPGPRVLAAYLDLLDELDGIGTEEPADDA